MKKIVYVTLVLGAFACGSENAKTVENMVDSINEELTTKLEEEKPEEPSFDGFDPAKVYGFREFLDLWNALEDNEEWNERVVKIKLPVASGNEGGEATYNDSTTTAISVEIPAEYLKEMASHPDGSGSLNSCYFAPSWYANNSDVIFNAGDTITVQGIFRNHWAKGPEFDQIQPIQE